MEENIKNIKESSRKEIIESKDLKTLNDLRVKYLGKKGELTLVLRGMGKLSPEERPVIGSLVNKVRDELEILIQEKENELKKQELQKRLENEVIDVTEPSKKIDLGSKHPITQIIEEVEEIFLGMGYKIADGPEVEKAIYNFDKLNTPPDHPARDIQDTFYINEELVLRSQTSPVQARVMENEKPPIKIICPGTVYRSDSVDATHSPVFHQVEGLVIDKNISMADLKGTLEMFAKKCLGENTKIRFRPHHFPFTEPSAEEGTLEMFAKKCLGENTKIRFRPHHFPFTEPSAEADVSCFVCGGKGCRVCKGEGWIELLGCGMVHPNVLRNCGIDPEEYSGFAFGFFVCGGKGCRVCKGEGWIELLGCGMVHPNVLRNCGIDPEEYSGFAFGFGVERIAMAKFGIDDMRLLFENDVRFLKQF